MSRAALRYAKALLELALEAQIADKVQADMEHITACLHESRELQLFLHSPIINSDIKYNAMAEIVNGAQKLTLNLFGLLQSKKRFEILADIAVAYGRLYDQSKGFDEATVTSAAPLDAALEQRIKEKAQQLSKRSQVILKTQVDPSLIGGFILRVGDVQYNASVAHRLRDLKQEFSH